MTDEQTRPGQGEVGPGASHRGSRIGPGTALSPKKFKRYFQAQVAEAVPQLVSTLIDQSNQGSVGHMRLLLSLSGLDEPAAQRKPGKTRDVAKELARKWREHVGLRDSLKEA